MTAVDEDRGSGISTGIGKADRFAIWFVLIAGFFGGGFVAGLALITGVFRLLDPARYPIPLLGEMPAETGPGIAQARWESLVVNAEHLSAGPLWLLAGADVILGLTIGCVTASFAYALYRILQRKPFHRNMRTAALVAGSAIAIGGLLHQAVGGLGTMMAAGELNDSLGGVAFVGFEFQPLVPLIGFGVLALAYVFQAGNRIQRDTEGLI